MAPEPTPDPAPDGGATPPDPPAPNPQPEPAADEPLGDGGKRALDSERAARKAAEQGVKDLQAKLDELAAAQMTDQERAVDEARKAGRSEATTELRNDLFAAQAKLAASGKLADPTLLDDPVVALHLLGLTEPPVTADGKIDGQAVAAAVDQLVETRPSLASNGTAIPNPGSADGGARGTGKPPTIADQIAQAEKAGDWTTAGQLKAQQLMGLHQTT